MKTATGVSTIPIAKFGKGENITIGVLIKICEDIQYDLTDIMELFSAENEISSDSGITKGLE